MLQFQHPEYLWSFLILLLFIGIFISVLHWKKRKIRTIGDERLVRTMIEGYSSRRFVLKFIILIIAFALGIISAANLHRSSESDNIIRGGIDLVFALDVSKSMLATDLSPNRL